MATLWSRWDLTVHNNQMRHVMFLTCWEGLATIKLSVFQNLCLHGEVLSRHLVKSDSRNSLVATQWYETFVSFSDMLDSWLYFSSNLCLRELTTCVLQNNFFMNSSSKLIICYLVFFGLWCDRMFDCWVLESFLNAVFFILRVLAYITFYLQCWVKLNLSLKHNCRDLTTKKSFRTDVSHHFQSLTHHLCPLRSLSLHHFPAVSDRDDRDDIDWHHPFWHLLSCQWAECKTWFEWGPVSLQCRNGHLKSAAQTCILLLCLSNVPRTWRRIQRELW